MTREFAAQLGMKFKVNEPGQREREKAWNQRFFFSSDFSGLLISIKFASLRNSINQCDVIAWRKFSPSKSF
jgi:hypothetical protein